MDKEAVTYEASKRFMTIIFLFIQFATLGDL